MIFFSGSVSVKTGESGLRYLKDGRIIIHIIVQLNELEHLRKYGIGTFKRDGNIFIDSKDMHKYLE